MSDKKHIKTWVERCEEHPDHNGIVTERMIKARMQEEIDELWEEIERLRDELRQSSIDYTRAENERLREEVRVLRLYGNKDCTAMADEAMKEAALRREEA